jgi:SAM-dependent methyltransferase
MGTDRATTRDRIVGEPVDIDYDSTRRFFRGRADRAGDAVAQTTFQDHHPDLAQRRDRHESETILPRLGLGAHTRVLDIGCGSGRWAWKLADGTHGTDRTVRYHGIDFCDELVVQARAVAHHRELPGYTFQTLAAPDADGSTLAAPPPFDLALVVGVLMYLNDDDCRRVLTTLPRLVAATARLYLSEPIGLTDRLTLLDHHSTELEADYSAIYRTADDYESMFADHLTPAGFSVLHRGPLYAPEMRNRVETRQEYWILQR